MTVDYSDSNKRAAKGNTKAALIRSKKYCFTLNNYTNDEFECLVKMDGVKIIGKEVGKEGTPHLQGYVEFKNQRYLSALKKINERVHWEPARGTRIQNIRYCGKEKNYINEFTEKPPRILSQEQLYPWQREIERMILDVPDERSIYWYWEEVGNVGKTAFMKYLVYTYNFVIGATACRSADILTLADESKSVYLFDFSRSQEGFTPWNALEQLKNGFITDSKLKKKAKTIIMDNPHVICFANWPPETQHLSGDRWKITKLGE